MERERKTEEETIRDEDKDLEMKFINQLQNLQWSSLEVLPPRNRLEKLKMTKSIEESAERILGILEGGGRNCRDNGCGICNEKSNSGKNRNNEKG